MRACYVFFSRPFVQLIGNGYRYTILQSLQYLGTGAFDRFVMSDIVRTMRNARPFMVQSFAQYVYSCSFPLS